MIALAFFTGIIVMITIAILLVRGAKASPCPGAEVLTEGDRDFLTPYLPPVRREPIQMPVEIPRAMSASELARRVRNGEKWTVLSPHEWGMWDVAKDPDPQVPLYMYGVTGHEKD
jgi:hypothetical protein